MSKKLKPRTPKSHNRLGFQAFTLRNKPVKHTQEEYDALFNRVNKVLEEHKKTNPLGLTFDPNDFPDNNEPTIKEDLGL